MHSHVQQVKSINRNGSNVATTTTEESTDTLENDHASASVVAARIIWFIVGVINTILALRFILILLGANVGNGFANFIYNISYPFVVPFFGIFGYHLRYGVSRVELSALFAILIYSLVGFGLARLLTLSKRY